MLFSYLTLFTALVISLGAAVYSIIGLTAIFAAAFWPIVIMGSSLEVGKIVTTLWLHKYWDRVEIQYKLYLCSAVAILMLLTSMGVFGFLSKAHLDQAVPAGDIQATVQIFDDKIKTQRDNIDAARRALTQMDAAVDQTMSRSTSEQGADKAANLRRSQQRERGVLQADISRAQAEITKLQEQRAPSAAQARVLEAEVGPIKYIAALIYGDNPESNVLEKAVRWVIILIVVVFDPLAIVLLLAASKSIQWERGINIFAPGRRDEPPTDESSDDAALDRFFDRARNAARAADNDSYNPPQPAYEPDDGPLTDEQFDQLLADAKSRLPGGRVITKDSLFPATPTNETGKWDEFFAGTKSFDDVTTGAKLEPDPLPVHVEPHQPGWMFPAAVKQEPEILVEEIPVPVQAPEPVVEDEITKLAKSMWQARNPDTTIEDHQAAYESGKISTLPWQNAEHINDLPISDGERKRLMSQTSQPVAQPLQADNAPPLLGTVTGFGIEFPAAANKGDMFLRVDQLPTVLYKFNGNGWIPVDKSLTDSYAYDTAYIDHLISKISSGEYDLDLLSDAEREQIALRLKDQQG